MPEPGSRDRAGRQPDRAATWLVYGVAGLLAAVLCSQYFLRSPNTQQLSSASDNVARSQVTPSGRWQRISLRCQDRDDLDRSLPVLLDFLEHPAHALSLTELTIDNVYDDYCGGEDPLVVDPKPASAQEERLAEAARAIGLERELEDQILEALFWKVRGLEDPELENGWGCEASMRRCHQRNRRRRYLNAAAILFCSVAPNISSLRTTEPTGTLAEFFLTVNYRWAAQGTGTTLASLARIDLIEHGTYSILNDERMYRYSGPLDFIQHFHRLPSFTAFSAYTIADGHAEVDLLPPGLSQSLKSISIRRSDIGSKPIGVLIRLATALEDVHFSVGGRSPNHGGFSSTHPKAIGKALEQHQTTLRSIDLDLDEFVWDRTRWGAEDVEHEDWEEARPSDQDHDYHSEILEYARKDPRWKADEEESAARGYPLLSRDLPDTKPYGNTIGSFAAFEKLHTLKIGIKLLLGPYDGSQKKIRTPPESLVDMFPASLTHLTIRGYRKGQREMYDRHVEQLREQMATKLPALVSVEGLAEEVPSGKTVSNPDAAGAPLYVEPAVEDGWLESEDFQIRNV